MTKLQIRALLLLFHLSLVAGLAPAASGGAVFISGDDADDVAHCQDTACGGLYPRVLTILYRQCEPVPLERNGILAIGVNGQMAHASLLGWNNPVNGGPGAPITYAVTTAAIASAVFENYRVLYIPSYDADTEGGIRDQQLLALNARKDDLARYINDNNGRLLALTEIETHEGFMWLPNPLEYDHIFDSDIAPTLAMEEQFPGTGATDENLDHCCYHNDWIGPNGYSGLQVLAVTRDTQIPDPADPSRWIDAPVILGGCNVRISREVCGNGSDDDGDGRTDEADEDCHRCGDGNLDPGEQCDDGNLLGGDGCDATCRSEGANQPPLCDAGGAYTVACTGGRYEVRLDGARSIDPEGLPLEFTWSSDCPDATVADPAASATRLSGAVAGCGASCKVTLTVIDSGRQAATCSSSVEVSDHTAPEISECRLLPRSALAPIAPRPPHAPSSPCSLPRREVLEVSCGRITDACDPAPHGGARGILTRIEPGPRGSCRTATYDVPLACGEVVEIDRTPIPCNGNSRNPKPPRPPSSVNADGRRIFFGDVLRLEVTAEDACGNRSELCAAESATCGSGGGESPLGGRSR